MPDLTDHINTHIQNHMQHFKHADSDTKKTIEELAIPQIELHQLYMHYSWDNTVFEPTEHLFGDLVNSVANIVAPVAKIVAPLPQIIEEKDKFADLGVDMDEIKKQEQAEIEEVPLHLLLSATELETIEKLDTIEKESKKQQYRQFFHSQHWQNKMSNKVVTNLHKVGSDLLKDPHVRFSAELEIFKRKFEELVQQEHQKIIELYDEGSITEEVKIALLKTVTVENIVQEQIEKDKRKGFAGAEPLKDTGILVEADNAPHKVHNLTNDDTKQQLDQSVTRGAKMFGNFVGDQAINEGNRLVKLAYNYGSLVQTFIKHGAGLTTACSYVSFLFLDGVGDRINAAFYTCTGVVAGAASSMTVLAAMHNLCNRNLPNLGGVPNAMEEGLNKLSWFFGTLDKHNLADVEHQDMDIGVDEVNGIWDEHQDLADKMEGTDVDIDDYLGAKKWMTDYLEQQQIVTAIATPKGSDELFEIQVGDKILSLGSSRERRNELFYKIGQIDGMESDVFTGANGLVKEFRKYTPFTNQPNKICLFTRLTMGKLISFVESLDDVEKSEVYDQFHLEIPLNHDMGNKLMACVSKNDADKWKNGERICYPANCVFNIIEQAENAEMIKKHKDNRDYEALFKNPGGTLLFRCFSGLLKHFKTWTFDIAKTICVKIWNWMKEAFQKLIPLLVGEDAGRTVEEMFEWIWNFMTKVANVDVTAWASPVYKKMLSIVDWVAERQTGLLVMNTVVCIGIQTLFLVGSGGFGVSVGASNYLLWKGVNLATEMMGMQVVNAVMSLMGNAGRWFNAMCENTSWFAYFVKQFLPGPAGKLITKMFAFSEKTINTFAGNAAKGLDTKQQHQLLGVGGMFVAGVASFYSMPFAVVGGLLSAGYAGYNNIAVKQDVLMHFPEAFKNCMGVFHRWSKNLLMQILSGTTDGFGTIWKKGGSLTYQQLVGPLFYMDMLCKWIFTSGTAGRSCPKIQKIMNKVWKQYFASRFLFGFVMDVAVFAGVCSSSLLGGGLMFALPYGNCSGHLRRQILNDFKKVTRYKGATNDAQPFEFVVEKDGKDVSKIIRVVIGGQSHDVIVTREIDPNKPKYTTPQGKRVHPMRWLVTNIPKMAYDKDGKLATESEKLNEFDNVNWQKQLDDLQLHLTINEKWSGNKSDGVIAWADQPLSFELYTQTRVQHENLVIVDERGNIFAVCENGEYRTMPLAGMPIGTGGGRGTPGGGEDKPKLYLDDLRKKYSVKLDKKAAQQGIMKIAKTEVNSQQFIEGWAPTETTNQFKQLDHSLTNGKDGDARMFRIDDLTTTQKTSLNPLLGEGIEMNGYRVVHVEPTSELLKGASLTYRTTTFRDITKGGMFPHRQAYGRILDVTTHDTALEYAEQHIENMPDIVENLPGDLKHRKLRTSDVKQTIGNQILNGATENTQAVWWVSKILTNNIFTKDPVQSNGGNQTNGTHTEL